MREKAIKFLTMKLKGLPEDALDKDSQDFVVTECKKVGFLEYGNFMLKCPYDVNEAVQTCTHTDTLNVLTKYKTNVKNFQLKIFIFAAEKIEVYCTRGVPEIRGKVL